jgi:hypothetical protein
MCQRKLKGEIHIQMYNIHALLENIMAFVGALETDKGLLF